MNIDQPQEKIIYSIGHSILDLKNFISILKSFNINQVVDIRSIPRSRHNPQYNFEIFPKNLRNSRINYRHLKKLGGLRKPRKDSINMAWENSSFRGFADYMQGDDFLEGLSTVLELMQKKTLVLMCAEALPWRCHRSLIGDALVVRGVKVYDIFGPHTAKIHKLTPWAQVSGTLICYP